MLAQPSPSGPASDDEATTGPTTGKIRVFVSYDREHDEDLHERLEEQASKKTAGFEISARSRTRPMDDLWDHDLHRDIGDADEVIVICGEHTESSGRVATELRIAQEEKRPYFLLWGRREIMCTRPATARPADAMYSWAHDILENQIVTILRMAPASEPAKRAAESTGAVPTPEG